MKYSTISAHGVSCSYARVRDVGWNLVTAPQHNIELPKNDRKAFYEGVAFIVVILWFATGGSLLS
jgi:hypothetical protein